MALQERRPRRTSGENRFRAEPASDKYGDLLRSLESQVEAVHDSESFQCYLKVQSRFYKYSFGNTMLIAAQRPDATRVAGYKAWQRLGRQVQKGERGIQIIVPMPLKRTNEAGEEETKMRFGVGHVFDVGQTDGEPLPEFDVPVLEGDEGGHLYMALSNVCLDEGVSLRERERMEEGKMGFYVPSNKEIVVRAGVPQLQKTKTLLHELGHHFTGMHETYGELRAEHEAVAEGTAFVVAAHYGLDTSARSVPYIASWTENRDRFRSVLGTIQGVSAHLIDRLDRQFGVSPVADELAAQPVEPPAPPAL